MAFPGQWHHLEGSGIGTGWGHRPSPISHTLGFSWISPSHPISQPIPPEYPPPLGMWWETTQSPRKSRSCQSQAPTPGGQGHIPILWPLFLAHLSHGFHVLQVAPAEPHPAPAPMRVEHLLRRHPRLWLALWRDRDPVFPALGRREHLVEVGEEPPPPNLGSHREFPTVKAWLNPAKFPSGISHLTVQSVPLECPGMDPWCPWLQIPPWGLFPPSLQPFQLPGPSQHSPARCFPCLFQQDLPRLSQHCLWEFPPPSSRLRQEKRIIQSLIPAPDPVLTGNVFIHRPWKEVPKSPNPGSQNSQILDAKIPSLVPFSSTALLRSVSHSTSSHFQPGGHSISSLGRTFSPFCGTQGILTQTDPWISPGVPAQLPEFPVFPHHVRVGISHVDPLPSGKPDLVLKHLLHKAQVSRVHVVQQPESREYPKIRDSPSHPPLAPSSALPNPSHPSKQRFPSGKTQTRMKIPPQSSSVLQHPKIWMRGNHVHGHR